VKLNLDRSKLMHLLGHEEVPRWIGLSLVLIYVGGLAAVGYAALEESFGASRDALRRAAEHSATLLARVLDEVDADDVGGQQRALRAFAEPLACEQLRIYGRDGTVLASIHADEIGRPVSANLEHGTMRPIRMEVFSLTGPAGEGRVLFRLPVTSHIRAAAPTSANTDRFLEGVVYVAPVSMGVAAGQLRAMAIGAAATAAFLLIYRKLRRHLRSAAQISENLTAHPALEPSRPADRGELLRTELASLRIADSLGGVACCWNRLIDLTEELRAEAQRAAAASELHQVLEKGGGGDLSGALNAIPDGIIHIVEERHLAFANTAACRLLGIGADDDAAVDLDALAGQAADEAPARSPVLELVRSARLSGGNYAPKNEIVHVSSEGSSYRVRILPLRLTAPGRQQGECVVTIADVSQQVRADRAREDFVSQVTHELRTPLTNIRAYAETLSSGMFDDPKVITECYNVITKETRRLSRLIEDILSISQIEVGTIRLVVDDVDLRSLMTDAVRDVRGLAEEKKINLQLALPAKLEPIRADRDKLAVVINNLLGNAIKYTPESGEVHVACKVASEQVIITVKDNGIGVLKEDQERIFEKFQRGSDPRVAEETGTGIGLTTAREIARRHGGDIELMSAPGQGSTFVVKLPRRCDGSGGAALSLTKGAGRDNAKPARDARSGASPGPEPAGVPNADRLALGAPAADAAG